MKLSNSAIDLYYTCPRKYKLHYIDKLRSTLIGSPLFFGSSIDNACNVLLLNKKKNLTEEEKILVTKNPAQVFEDKLRIVNINDKPVNIEASPRATYFAKDFDLDFLSQTDVDIINQAEYNPFELQFDQLKDFKSDCQKTIKSGQELSTDLLITYNAFCWRSLYHKGLYLIDCYKKLIIPKIDEVIQIQEEINLPDVEGNYITGFIDLEARLTDGNVYILDNKTSSAKYPQEKFDNSQQLSIYTEFKQNRNAGYLVMLKPKQKNPEKQIQILTGKISEETVNNVFDKIGEFVYNVKNENFEPNFNNCFQFFTKCPYYDLCRFDDSLKNLEDLNEKE